jgi:hypothetical protein
MVNKQDDFSQLAHKIVIHEKRGSLKDLATVLGLTYTAFYNRLIGRAEFNPREINLLIRELADPRLGECLLAGTGFRSIQQGWNSTTTDDQDLDIVISALTFVIEALQAKRNENLIVTISQKLSSDSK